MNRPLLFVVVFALLLRAGMLWCYSEQLTVDTDAYLAHAEGLVEGRGFSKPGTKIPTAFRPPLLPVLYALILGMGGGTWSIGFVQLLLGGATVWLTGKLGEKMGLGDHSWLAAFIVALDPLLLFAGVSLMTETLFTFLLMVWICCLLPVGASKKKWTYGLVGILTGMLALCRPSIWAFFLLYACWRLLSAFWSKTSEEVSTSNRFVERWGHSIAFSGGLLLILAPWVLRNYSRFDFPVLTTTHGGYTLHLGNNPVFYEEVVQQPWGTRWSEESLKQWQAIDLDWAKSNERPTAELPRDRWHQSEAIHWMLKHPDHFREASWLKFRRFWNVAPLTDHSSLIKWSMGLFYGGLFLFSSCGLLFVLMTKRTDWTPFLLLLLSFSLVHTVYWSNMRMRAPLEPILALLATFGWIELRKRISERIERNADRSGQSLAGRLK